MSHSPSTLVRTSRFAHLESPVQTESSFELARIAAAPLATLDGTHLTGLTIYTKRTLIMLIDAYRPSPDRIAAEIGWVRERLDPAIELVLIWPPRATAQARALYRSADLRMYVDRQGDVRRLVSTGGQRIALLADSTTGTLERITGANAIFAMRRGVEDTRARGTDRMIDLGDVHH